MSWSKPHNPVQLDESDMEFLDIFNNLNAKTTKKPEETVTAVDLNILLGYTTTTSKASNDRLARMKQSIDAIPLTQHDKKALDALYPEHVLRDLVDEAEAQRTKQRMKQKKTRPTVRTRAPLSMMKNPPIVLSIRMMANNKPNKFMAPLERHHVPMRKH